MKHGQEKMALKVFLDANVIPDLYLKREGYEYTKQIMSLVINGQCQAYVNPSILHIVNYRLKKEIGNKKAEQHLLELLVNVDVVDINYETTVSALHSKIGDLEDSLHYYTGLHHNLDYFISRDKALKESSTPILPVYDPEEFLKIVDIPT
jgi:predicted nucleic acid-binding protein